MNRSEGVAVRTRAKSRALLLVMLAASLTIAMPAMARTVAVSEKDNGGECVLERGDTLAVSLEAKSGTGYVWQVAKIDTAMLKSAGDAKFELKGESMPGAAWNQTFRFTAETAGSSALELNYLRPWEKSTAPAKQFTVNVLVK